METNEIENAIEDVWRTGVEIVYEQWAKLEDQYGTNAVLTALETYAFFSTHLGDYEEWREERGFEDIA